ncbi:MAG: hypothetical protein AAGI38_08675 [Bacteroidota bacterium]
MPALLAMSCAFILIVIGALLLNSDDGTSLRFIIWIQCIFAPFYIPELYYYVSYLSRDEHTRVEIDTKDQLIKYEKKGTNMLFPVEHIQKCEVFTGLFAPTRLRYVKLNLINGQDIYISNLVVPSVELTEMMNIPCTYHRAIFNTLPKSWS